MTKIVGAIRKGGSFLYTHKLGIACNLCFAIIFFLLGWQSCKHFGANTVEKIVTQVEIQTVEIPAKTEQQTVIQYIEKESSSDSDISITNKKPQIVVDYNGEQTTFDTLDTETQKFDKGKLEVKSETKTVLDVTPIVEKEVKATVDKAVQDNADKLNEEFKVKLATEKKDHKKHILESFIIGAGIGFIAHEGR